MRSGTLISTPVTAANEVLLQFVTVTALVLDGFAFVTEKETGEAWGARDRAQLVRAVRLTSEFALVSAALLSCAWLFGGAWLLETFVADPEVGPSRSRTCPGRPPRPALGVAAWQLDGLFLGTVQGRALRNAGVAAAALYVACDLALRFAGNDGVWAALLAMYALRAIALGVHVPDLLARGARRAAGGGNSCTGTAPRTGRRLPLADRARPVRPLRSRCRSSMVSNSSRRGRDASRPSQIPKAGWRDIALRVKDEIATDHVTVVAAGVAFFGLLAVFPAIAALISIAALVLDPATIEAQLSIAAAALPENAAAILQDQASAVAEGAGGGVGLAAIGGLLISIYSASKGTKTLMEGMNIAYDEDEDRGFIKMNLVALALTALLVVGVLVALGSTVVVSALLGGLGLSSTARAVVEYGRRPVLALIVILGLAELYPLRPVARGAGVEVGSPSAPSSRRCCGSSARSRSRSTR